MEAILLPTDFSETSLNAAKYALQLAGQLNVRKIVLYHSYEILPTIDPIAPAMQMLDIESLKVASEKNIREFAERIRPFAGDTHIELLSEYGAITAGVDDVCEKTNSGLVVMGITGGNLLEEKLIGSNTLTIAKHTNVPVIIVPPKTPFTRIDKIMLTGDLSKEDTRIPLEDVRRILAETKARLLVLNVDEKDTTVNETVQKQLSEISAEYHFSQSKRYVEVINSFAIEHKIDLVITVLRKHGFFEGLFSDDHTKMLAFHGELPLMVIHRTV